MSPSEDVDPHLELQAAHRRVFETPDGIVVLDHMIDKANLNATTFVAGDPYQSAFREGKRAMILDILRTLDRSDLRLRIARVRETNERRAFEYD